MVLWLLLYWTMKQLCKGNSTVARLIVSYRLGKAIARYSVRWLDT